jgi:metalloendopeptidase OMA1, mitochondrial
MNFPPSQPPRTRSISCICFLFAFLLPLAITGCDAGLAEPPTGEGPGHRQQVLALRPDQELAVGQQAYRQVLQEYRGRILPADDPRVRRVRAVVVRIVRAAGIEPLQREINLHVKGYRFEWEANVVEDRRVNAFCLPGGKIVVYSAILQVTQNDDQLATVLSHEIAHALAHHSNERVTREESGRVNVLLNKAFDRQQESEADHIGIFLMTFAGYNPEEATRFWERMRQLSQGREIPEILSDHPSDERRIRDIERWVPKAEAAKRAFDKGNIASARPTNPDMRSFALSSEKAIANFKLQNAKCKFEICNLQSSCSREEE